MTFKAKVTMRRTEELDGRNKTILGTVRRAQRFLASQDYDHVDLTISTLSDYTVIRVTLTRKEMEAFLGTRR